MPQRAVTRSAKTPLDVDGRVGEFEQQTRLIESDRVAAQ